MKTAIILFGDIDKEPESFLLSCADKVSGDGFTLLHTSIWKDYKRIEKTQFTERLLPVIDTIYLFIDFGVTDLMANMVKKFYHRDESGFAFSKEIRVEANYDMYSKTIGSILKEVSDVTKIPVELLKSRSKVREIAEARQYYFKRAKKFTNRSLTVIGALVNRDHATVMYGVRVVDSVREIREKYEELFEGKKRIHKPDKVVIPSEVTIEAKNMLIGRDTAKVINMISPYKDRESEIVKPYSGYRVHSF